MARWLELEMRMSNKIEAVMMMKKLIFLFVLIGIGSLFFGNEAAAQDKETESAKIPLNNYLQGQTHRRSRIYPQSIS